MSISSPLADRTIGDYLTALASDAHAPGGGSVAGVVGALAAGLGEMVVSLTPDPGSDLRAAAEDLAHYRASAVASGEADELAYGSFLEASRLPKTTVEDKAMRRQTMQEAIREAAEVPLELAATAVRILDRLEPVIASGNVNILSDAEIAITLAVACVDASLANVNVNLPLIKDAETAATIRDHAAQLRRASQDRAATLRACLAQRRG
jgi:formiminotetrahydrofolate cyclodeaminase